MTSAIINETTNACDVGRLSPHHHCKGVSGMASTSVSPRTFNREELAWAAGFYDGEGHTRVRLVPLDPSRRGNQQVQLGVVINQASSPELLERFRRAVGVGNINGPYKKGLPSHKPQYAYSTQSFQSVQHCICCLWPWLGSAKRNQALNVLRTWLAQPRQYFRGVITRIVCSNGHRVEGPNAYVTPSGHTQCRECRRSANRRDSERRKKVVAAMTPEEKAVHRSKQAAYARASRARARASAP